MATRFSSAAGRQLWLAAIYSLIVDCIVAFLIARVMATNTADAFVGAFFIVISAYGFLLLYGILGAAKYSLLFFAYERKQRIENLVDQFSSVRMPRPGEFYSDPTEYLVEVAMSDHASSNARLVAGSNIGCIETLRSTSRPLLTMFTMNVLEEAIGRYSRRFGRTLTSDDEIERRFQKELHLELGDDT